MKSFITAEVFDHSFFKLLKRIELLEHVFKRIAGLDMRLENLEFHSDVTLSPAINEQFLDMKLRLVELESLTKKESTNE